MPKRTRAGGKLIDYGVPGGANNKSIVYQDLKEYFHGKNQDGVDRFLLDGGISRLVVGHVPQVRFPHRAFPF